MKTVLSIVTSSSISGGAEKNLSYILKRYRTEGYDVHLIIWNIQGSVYNHWREEYDFNIYTINSKGFRGLVRLVNLLRSISRKGVDLTFISNITLASIVGILRRLKIFKTLKFIVRDPSSPFLRYTSKLKLLSYKLRYWAGYKSVDYLIFQTNLIKEQFYLNIKSNTPSVVLGNPVDVSEIKLKSQESTACIEGKYIVACGRLIKAKGFELLIQAFYESKMFESYSLVILGDGILRQTLQDLAIFYGIESKVVLMGFVNNPFPYFRGAEACVISSISEGFPNVLLQMMTLNKKVIMTKCCGDLEKIPAIKLIESNSVLSLKNALVEVLDCNEISFSIKEKEVFLLNRTIQKYTDTILSISLI